MDTQLNELAMAPLIMIGILSLVLAALIIYLVLLLSRIEQTLYHMRREIERNTNGHILRPRI